MSRSATTIILRTSRTSRRAQVVPVLLSLPLPFENSRYSIYKHLKWDFTTTANKIQWIHTHGLLFWQNLHLENKMYLFFESVWIWSIGAQLHNSYSYTNTSQRCVTRKHVQRKTGLNYLSIRANLNNLKLQKVGTGLHQPWAGGRAEVYCPCPGRWRWRRQTRRGTSPSQPERPHPPAPRSPWTCYWWTWAAPSLSPHSLARKSWGQEKLQLEIWTGNLFTSARNEHYKLPTLKFDIHIILISNNISSDNLCDLVELWSRQIARKSWLPKPRRLK